VDSVAAKVALATGFDDVLPGCGVGDDECRADVEGEALRERDGVADGEAEDGDSAGSSEIVADGDWGSAAPTGMAGIDGRTTVGPAARSEDGPTARTATQTTSAIRMVTAARKTSRAGLIGVEECLEEGNDRAFRIC
jgi:hypothetical protein